MSAVNPYQGRWRWWYESIADWMIRNPDGLLKDCAAELDKHPNTISYIIHSDMFKEYFAKRKAEWVQKHDLSIVAKTTKIAELGLDVLLESLEKKREKVPIETIDRITNTALERLGYGQKEAPAVQVNVDQRTAVVQVSAEALHEARMSIRALEDMKKRGMALPAPAGALGQVLELESTKVGEDEEDVTTPPL